MNNLIDNKLDDDLLRLKPYLRFKIGDVVCLKGDPNQKALMTIVNAIISDQDDYVCTWLDSQKKRNSAFFPDAALVKYVEDTDSQNETETSE